VDGALERATQEHGVPAEIIVAIIGVETLYGRNTGKFPTIQALSTLAFDFPPRAAYFRKELEQFLLYCRENGLDPLTPRGSYAGATVADLRARGLSDIAVYSASNRAQAFATGHRRPARAVMSGGET